MYVNTSGLVLRETVYMESSKILTVLTSSEGKVTVTARGALRRNSKYATVTQLLVFSEMTLFSSRDRWTLTEARSIEQFIGLRSDVVKLALGSYFAELAEAVSDEDSPNLELLPLCLNALYALSEGIREPKYVKPAFELRLMAISGFEPILSHCCVCNNNNPERAVLDIVGGRLYCTDCAPGNDMPVLGRGALDAIRFILGCEAKRVFSFSLGDSALREVTQVAEAYLLGQLGRRFRTLDFYKSVTEFERHG